MEVITRCIRAVLAMALWIAVICIFPVSVMLASMYAFIVVGRTFQGAFEYVQIGFAFGAMFCTIAILTSICYELMELLVDIAHWIAGTPCPDYCDYD